MPPDFFHILSGRRRTALLGWPDNGPLFFMPRSGPFRLQGGTSRSNTKNMSQPDKIEFIAELVAPLAASLGLSVWGVEIGGAARPIARIYVDTLPGAESEPKESAEESGLSGVTVDQCAELSRLVGLALDVEDPFSGNWTLEVSSPGLERPFFAIDQLRAYAGRELDVVLSAPMDTWPGRKKFSGTLARVDDEEFVLDLPPAKRLADEPEQAVIAWHLVRRARLVHHFSEPQKPGKNREAHDSRGTSGGAA